MPINLRIGSDSYNFFNKATIEMKYAHTASKFQLTALYDSRSADYRRIFKPLDYKDVVIETTRGETLITGTVLNVGFGLDKNQRFATISGYSKTGILQDCSIPIGTPYQFNGLTLRQIATQLLRPFDLGLVVNNAGQDADRVLDEITASPTESVFSFLTSIAAQSNLVLTNTPDGRLEITRPRASVPSIATYREEFPATMISLSVEGQNFHSDLTAMQQPDFTTNNAAQQTVRNPLVNAFRPITKIQSVGTDNDSERAAQNIRANELRNISLSILSDRWDWLNNGRRETIMPNNIVTVISPENYIYNPTDFFVESVTLMLDSKKETALMRCVPPQVYNNQEPKQIFNV